MADQQHLVLHPVRADRVEDFDRFLFDVVVPAFEAERPDLSGRWRALRSAPANGVVTYAFWFDGGTLHDWDVDPVLPKRYGEAEADRLTAEWVETFAALEPWTADAITAAGDTNQLAWTLEPVIQP